ncbi:hypothetical protein Bca4012_065568 [Brassica carinata]
MYAGRSGTQLGPSVRHGQKTEPRLKCSGRPDLRAGLVPRTDPRTGAHHLSIPQLKLNSKFDLVKGGGAEIGEVVETMSEKSDYKGREGERKKHTL